MVGREQFATRADDVIVQPHGVAKLRVEVGGGPVVEQNLVILEILNFKVAGCDR